MASSSNALPTLAKYLSSLTTLRPPWKSFSEQFPNGLVAVVGNESADVDSIACALAYAWWLTVGPQKEGEIRGGGGGGGDEREGQKGRPACVPMIQILREELGLRGDAVHLLKTLGLDMSGVWFAEEMGEGEKEFGKENGEGKGIFSVVLVDHNQMGKSLASLVSAAKGHVEEIVDHHADEGLYREWVGEGRRCIQTAGSCASLVALRILKRTADDGPIDRGDVAWLDENVRRLLLAPILLDTANLLPAAGRATGADKEAAGRLAEGLLGEEETARWHGELLEKKADVASLTPRQLLLKDYKQWTLGKVECGIASMPVKLSVAAEPSRGQMADDMAAFRQQRSLDILVVNTLFTEADVFARELLLLGPEQLVESTDGYLQAHTDFDLVPLLVPSLSAPDGLHLRVYTQRNLLASRKQIQPALANFYLQSESE